MDKEKIKGIEDYQYGFADKDTSIYKTKQGLTKETVLEISKIKNEPEWMLEFRLKALDIFNRSPMPKFGPDLSSLDFDSYTYFIRPSEKEAQDWNEVPETIKNTTLKNLKNGDIVNIEYDLFAKYIQKFTSNKQNSKLTFEFLKENGF